MTTEKEAQALITTAGVYLKRYKAANAALKEAKAALEEHMDANNLEDLPGTEEGTGARFVERSGRQLDLAQMPDELIIWCAANGVLSGSLGKFDDLPDDTRAQLKPYIVLAAGTRYVDLYYPSWGTNRQQQKETARAASTAPPPPVAPPLPFKPATQQPAKKEQSTSGSVWTCPEHPERQPKPSKWGGFYCTGYTEDGEYCKQTSKKQTSQAA
jgi:hypothetical protein